ncbi:MAG: dag [Firmicutes bacterium]|nr:dag [Bacillota bacterium]
MLDVAINHAVVIDTENNVEKEVNIGIKAGKIAVLTTEDLVGARIIEAKNLIASPGFIDVHGHVDGYAYSGELSACQGITTTIGGNCGLSPVNIAGFFARQAQHGFVINQAELIGHSFSLRQAVGISDPYRQATPKEFTEMESLARRALEAGACGLSFGLDYSPGASFDEIKTLAKVCAEFDRVMPIHTRLFTQNDLYSLFEVLAVAKRTGVRLLISHFVYQYGTGIMEEALQIIDQAIDGGIDVKIDSGMYTDWTTFIGTATFDEQTIADNEIRFSDMIVASGPYTGERLNRNLYLEMRKNSPNESVICFMGNKAEIYTALKKNYAMPSTDIGTYKKGEGHPQIAGSFPKYFKEMVKERGDFSLVEAVRKATLLPAQTFGFENKGVIKIGSDADVTLFDFEQLADKAQFPDRGRPDAKPTGIVYVLVNGIPVIDQGCFTGAKAGQVIKLL